MPHPQRSSGSDQSRSHIGPSWGTSWTRSKSRMWSNESMLGERPPCKQKISDSTWWHNSPNVQKFSTIVNFQNLRTMQDNNMTIFFLFNATIMRWCSILPRRPEVISSLTLPLFSLLSFNMSKCQDIYIVHQDPWLALSVRCLSMLVLPTRNMIKVSINSETLPLNDYRRIILDTNLSTACATVFTRNSFRHRGSYECSQREIIKEVSEDLPDVGISIPTHINIIFQGWAYI